MWKKRKRRLGDVGASTPPAAPEPGPRGLANAMERAGGATRCLVTWAVISLAMLSAPGLAAKEKKITKVVAGTVLDAADNPIPDATVTLTDLNTGKKIALSSQGGGLYQFPDLDPLHDYEVQATYKGSSSEVRHASSIDPRNRIILNLKIPPPKP